MQLGSFIKALILMSLGFSVMVQAESSTVVIVGQLTAAHCEKDSVVPGRFAAPTAPVGCVVFIRQVDFFTGGLYSVIDVDENYSRLVNKSVYVYKNPFGRVKVIEMKEGTE